MQTITGTKFCQHFENLNPKQGGIPTANTQFRIGELLSGERSELIQEVRARTRAILTPNKPFENDSVWVMREHIKVIVFRILILLLGENTYHLNDFAKDALEDRERCMVKSLIGTPEKGGIVEILVLRILDAIRRGDLKIPEPRWVPDTDPYDAVGVFVEQSKLTFDHGTGSQATPDKPVIERDLLNPHVLTRDGLINWLRGRMTGKTPWTEYQIRNELWKAGLEYKGDVALEDIAIAAMGAQGSTYKQGRKHGNGRDRVGKTAHPTDNDLR